jgi:hypothetical protein
VAPIESTPIRITRTGERLDTDYEVEAFEDKPIDLSGLLDFVDGITYLNDEMDELLEGIEGAEDDFAAAGLIGSLLLDKKLNDMCDEEYYNEVLEKLTEPAKFSKKRKESSQKTSSRPARQSQRRSQRAEEPEAAPDQEPEAEEEKPKPRRSRKAVSKEESSPRERMNALRERSAVKADKA